MNLLARETTRALLRGMHLGERVLLGPLTPRLRTPSSIVQMWEKASLRHYQPIREVLPLPVLIVPPLMVQPTIFDLRAGHSMIQYLMEAGLDVYLIDFGIPKPEDRTITVDDYVTDFIPSAMRRIAELSGSSELSLVGWSMGGIMSYLACALYADENRVRNLVTLGSPVDFSQMFPFNILATLGQLPLQIFVDVVGNIPPILTINGFRLISPATTVWRYVELALNYWDREWVAGYESINDWVGSFIPYPAEAFKQFVQDFIIEDKLRGKRLKIGGRIVDLGHIPSSVQVFSGTKDKIAPRASVEAVRTMLPEAAQIILEQVPLGHIGMVAGSEAPVLVWDRIADFLCERSQARSSGRGKSGLKSK
ncbi:MAG: alpha/beta fold hydrolase [Candidatus Alcyoniella australis]|nr:alpha/beta fold hydrolase [Candidatus Alcyoniella australis]